MRACAEEGEHPTGLAAILFTLLTGFRRMEVLALERCWLNAKEHYVYFPGTKSGEQLRAIGQVTVDCIRAQPVREGHDSSSPRIGAMATSLGLFAYWNGSAREPIFLRSLRTLCGTHLPA